MTTNNADQGLTKWRTVSSRIVVDEKWLKVRADKCITPDGQTIDDWYVLEYPDWVNCTVIDREHNVIILNHYRHGIDRFIPEIVAGGIEADESAETAIKRELLEEIGYEGGELHLVGVTYANAANQPNRNHSFLAVGGSCSAKSVDELGANFAIEKVPAQNFMTYLSSLKSPNSLQTYHYAAIMQSLNFMSNRRGSSQLIDALMRELRL